MSFSGLIAVLALALGAVFAALNQQLLFEPRTVAIPGGTYAIPLVGILLGSAAAAIILMLLGEAGAAASWRTSKAKLTRRIYDQSRELLDLKTQAHMEIDSQVEDLRRELSERIDSLARLIETSAPAATATDGRTREVPDQPVIRRETTATRRS
jgi:uncharacterized integral membrane protein